jgi:hypothetical protein
VCECDALSRPGAGDDYAPAAIVREALDVASSIDPGAIAAEVMARPRKADGPPVSEAIGKAVRAARLRALKRWREERKA